MAQNQEKNKAMASPQLISVAPEGSFAFVNLRGPNPLTGKHKNGHNVKGFVPI